MFSVIIGYIVGEFLRLIYLLLIIRKNGLIIAFDYRSYGEIKEFIRVGSYQSASTALSGASPVIDKMVAYFLSVGSVTLLDYGEKLFIASNIVLNSFLVLMIQKWSEEVSTRSFSKIKFNRLVLAVFLIGLVLVAFMFIAKDLIAHLLYPGISASQQALVANIFLCNTLAFAFNCPNQVVVRGIIVFKKTKLLIKTSLIKCTVNLILDILLIYYFGVLGIAVSTIIVNVAGLFINWRFFSNITSETPLRFKVLKQDKRPGISV